MLIRIPDNYQAVETFLKRNGIPFTFVEEIDVNVAIADKIKFLEYIQNLEDINVNQLIELNEMYFDILVNAPRNKTEERLNNSIKHAYYELINLLEI